METLVLSTGYEPLARITWQRAIQLLFLGKVEIVEEYDDRLVRSVIDKDEPITIIGCTDEIVADLRPQQDATLVIHSVDGTSRSVPLTLRIDTPIEVDYYRHGGILPFVLRQLLAA